MAYCSLITDHFYIFTNFIYTIHITLTKFAPFSSFTVSIRTGSFLYRLSKLTRNPCRFSLLLQAYSIYTFGFRSRVPSSSLDFPFDWVSSIILLKLPTYCESTANTWTAKTRTANTTFGKPVKSHFSLYWSRRDQFFKTNEK